MKIRQLSELLNSDIRKFVRQTFKKDLNVMKVIVMDETAGTDTPDGSFTIWMDLEDVGYASFLYDCHAHLLRINTNTEVYKKSPESQSAFVPDR